MPSDHETLGGLGNHHVRITCQRFANLSAIEDPSGRALAFAVDNATPEHALLYPYTKLCDIYPLGCVLAIREPYVCLGVASGLPQILVNVPTDIEILPHSPVVWRFPSPVSL